MPHRSRSAIDALIALRQGVREHLPVGNSLIPLDIILAVIAAHIAKERLTVKVLFSLVGRSTMGVRPHFNKLVAEGWLVVIKDSVDARTRHVMPTNALLETWSRFSSYVEKRTPQS